MRVYRLYISESAELLEPVCKSAAMRALAENATNPYSDWQGLVLQKMVIEQKKNKVELTDVTSVGMENNFPLCSSRVRETLTTTCGVTDQWLEVDFPEKDYSMLNLTHVIDALDAEHSTMKYFKSTGMMHKVTRFSFYPEIVENEWIFRDSTDRFGVFCTSRFADLIQKEGWTGFNLRPAWDSEHEPFMNWPTKTEIRARPEIFGPEGFIKGYQDAWPKEWHEEKPASKS